MPEYNKNKKVYVGMSGGVDSSTSVALLKEGGFDVIGVFIDVWQPEFLECTSGDDRRDAMRACAHLGIDLIRLDCREEYERKVVNYMLEEYKAGRTPNPDIYCNKYIKFGVFYDKAMADGADMIATGHYARVKALPSGKTELLRGVDKEKDQSYFLWGLKREQLEKIMFPIGEYEKSKVREIARSFSLPNAEKKDSQGICFLGKVDIKEFLSKYISKEKGDVLNEKGEVIGEHNGVWFLTEGQRHGFKINKKTPSDKPMYVTKKNIEKNEIIVSESNKTSFPIKSVKIEKLNLLTKSDELKGDIECQVRYRQTPLKCEVGDLKGNSAVISFKETQSKIASGQSLVIYKDDTCLGGGIISEIFFEEK